jgi:hypothetical protein
MTYGLVFFAQHIRDRIGEAVSHSAELVRGDFLLNMKAPSSGLRPPSPQGEKEPKIRLAASERAREMDSRDPRNKSGGKQARP